MTISSNPVHPSTCLRPRLLLAAVACTMALIAGGCTGRDGAYPDTTVETRNRADAIRADGERRKEAIATHRDERATAERFAAGQRSEQVRQEREAIDLARDKEVQPLKAERATIGARADEEQRAAAADAEQRRRGADATTAATIAAEAEARRAVSAQKAAGEQAALDERIAKAEATATTARAALDRRAAADELASKGRIADFEREAREQQLAVDRETTTALDKLAKDSGTRVAQSQAAAGEQLASDRRIAKEVRDSLDADRATYGLTTVAVRDGVVTLGGTVPSEPARRKALTGATGTNGVVRVDDQLQVKAQ